MRPAVTLAQARTELDGLTAALPWTFRREDRRTAFVAPLQEDTLGNARLLLWILLGAVVLLLVIACVNVASLCLARGAPREAEMAIRAALGCSRWRQIRQLLVESLILSLGGGLAGLLLAQILTRLLIAVAPDSVIGAADCSRLTPRCSIFSFGVVVLSAIGFGIAPALQFTRPNIESDAARVKTRSGTGSRRQTRTRNVLVISQIGLARDPAHRGRPVDAERARPAARRRAGRERQQRHDVRGAPAAGALSGRGFAGHSFHREFASRAGCSLPGIRAAGAVSRLPVTGAYHSLGHAGAPMHRPGRAVRPTSESSRAGTPRCFASRCCAAGRSRTRTTSVRRDGCSSIGGWPVTCSARQAVGQYASFNGDPLEVIGVVGDVAVIREGCRPPHGLPFAQAVCGRSELGPHTGGGDSIARAPSVLDGIRRELAAIDPALVLLPAATADRRDRHRRRARTLRAPAHLRRSLCWRWSSQPSGIYGVLSYSVTRRIREIGIRMALGAQSGAVLGLIVGDGGRLAVTGVILGLTGAWAATRDTCSPSSMK